MLVVSRKRNESLILDEDIIVTIVEIRGDKIRLGITAPKDATVHRREVYEAIQGQWSRSMPERMPSPEPMPTTPPMPCQPPPPQPATITLATRHVTLVDRLRTSIQQQGGWTPCREQTVEAILDALGEAEETLTGAASLSELKARMVEVLRGVRVK